ncbi:hypothetical protein J7L24_01655, partial [bacterium]|nr:hypothetical protein [bacterium]
MKEKNIKTLKYFLFRITPIVILLVVFAPLKAQAGLLDTIKSIPHKLIAFFLSFFIMIANVIARIASDLLNFVISPSAIKWSYTNPKNNPIIDSGLYVTKGFVSLALVVILVFIALSIALRIKEYASKKTLINLIVIALLVNFAPIVCGLIVDASNVITYYFLDKVQEKTNSIVGGLNPISIVNNITNISDEEGFWASMFSVFAKGIVMIIVNIAVAFIFFGYAFVFLFRYIAIWILVILSPLAFIAWILPITREKYWRMWWSQFINWSFIGVPGAFFLYLSLSIFN